MKEAQYYTSLEDSLVHCSLCPHNCRIKPGKRGICKVRKNIDGKLFSETYSDICSVGFDPIEKKPLYHFYPGATIFSVGSIGCNLHCRFCQNWEISQSNCDEYEYMQSASPERVVDMAQSRYGNIGIAYTYNEPSVWYEYMLDIARPAKAAGLKNVMVSNGFINPEPLKELLDVMDAFSIDLKAFSDDFYKKLTNSRLQPVLDTLKIIRDSGKHLEVTNLVITHQNDDPEEFSEMINWIGRELGRETVLHISRYFPVYKLDEPMTAEQTLLDFYRIASEKLQYVYLGNLRSNLGQDTYCPSCKKKTIERSGYHTRVSALDNNGNCNRCGHHILTHI